MRRLTALAAAALAAAGLLTAAAPADAAVPAGKADARVLLGKLTVREESHTGSYARTRFRVWNDADRDGENTRAEVLKTESRITASVSRSGTVKGGKWISAYDDTVVTKASRMDVDHLVPLAEAWRSGAWKWDAKRREAFGNDLGYGPSLIAVTMSSNRSKGDSDPSAWMPKATSYACAYVKQWIAVKSRWHLSVDRAERTALRSGLRGCSSLAVSKPGTPRVGALIATASPSGSTPLPAPVPTPLPVATPVPTAAPVSTPTASPTPSPSTSSSRTYYRNCDAVRAAGAAPLHRGQPGYETPRLDRDGDGVACE